MGTYKRMEFYWVEENHYRTSGSGVKSYAYLYGLSGKIHLFPIVTNKKTKIDLYIKSKLGISKFNSLLKSRTLLLHTEIISMQLSMEVVLYFFQIILVFQRRLAISIWNITRDSMPGLDFCLVFNFSSLFV